MNEIANTSLLKLRQAHLQYLDQLKERGEKNLLGGAGHLLSAFDNLSRKEALDILSYWDETYAERHQAAG